MVVHGTVDICDTVVGIVVGIVVAIAVQSQTAFLSIRQIVYSLVDLGSRQRSKWLKFEKMNFHLETACKCST